MPGLLLHTGALVQCPHLAPAAITPTQTKVLVSGQPVATTTAKIIVAGCPLSSSIPPSPCTTVVWQLLSTRVKVAGQAILLQPAPGTGQGLCQNPSQAPQGAPLVNQLQQLVTGA